MKALPQASAGANFHIGIMAGKVERRDAGDDAERLAHGIEVDARAGALGEFALQEVRDAAGELDDFEAALDVALGVGEGLAVLGREEPRELSNSVCASSRNFNSTRARRCGLVAAQAGCAASATAIACSTSDLLGERDPRLHLAGVGIEHVAEAS